MGVFEIKKTKDDGYMFNLKAVNGEIVATSQVYTTLGACKNGINSVIANAPIAPIEDQTVKGYTALKNPKFELYSDKSGDFRFRLKAANGLTIASGEGYTTKANCKNGIDSIKKNSVKAKIVTIK